MNYELLQFYIFTLKKSVEMSQLAVSTAQTPQLAPLPSAHQPGLLLLAS